MNGVTFDDDDGVLMLNFDTNHPEFYRGFEAGLIWAHAANCGSLDAIVHTVNTEMILRICEALDIPFRADPINDSLMRIQLGRAVDATMGD